MPEGCNAVFANVFSYFGTLIIFVVVFFVKMPVLSYPIVGNLFKVDTTNWNSQTYRYVILALWCIHFIRRIVEVLFVHIYNRRMSVLETIGGPIYYWIFSLFNVWAISDDQNHNKSSYKPGFFVCSVLGFIIFAIGEIGNCICHYQLRKFRSSEKDDQLIAVNGRRVPDRGLFVFVTCPHYFFEIVSWFGFFLVTWTLWSLLFLLCTFITLVIYSKKKHKAYQQQFDGIDGRPLYPKRNILIPFVF
ncbi:uncharacterized protein LOC101239560 [Hydra vulgaris]|uniref:Uncharacterized protein LOC101239560 n=1 Tax=Hydra vulgaris TaxID=6087 RepID=A0ABM4BQE1_HYDVU